MDLILIITGGVLVGCFIGLSWFAGTDAPYVPTRTVRIKRALKETGLKKGEIFWELGSGDGRVVIEAAKMGAKSFGIEQSFIRVLLSRWKARKQNPSNAHFIHGDIFSLLSFPRKRESIIDADVVYIFLLPKAVEKLEPLLKKNLKKGSVVITQTFHFKNWKPYRKILVSDKTPNAPLGKNLVEGDFWIYRV